MATAVRDNRLPLARPQSHKTQRKRRLREAATDVTTSVSLGDVAIHAVDCLYETLPAVTLKAARTSDGVDGIRARKTFSPKAASSKLERDSPIRAWEACTCFQNLKCSLGKLSLVLQFGEAR